MPQMTEAFVSSITQLSAVFLIGAFVYGMRWLLRRDALSFRDFLGLNRPGAQLDRFFFAVLTGVCFFAVVSVWVQYFKMPWFRQFLTGDTSPYGRILKDGFGVPQIFAGLLYCALQSGGAEEILFRGVIARAFFRRWGFALGNLFQATLFWIMHLLIFRLVTGAWISWIQVYAFVISFGLGLIFGYLNYRRGGRSILPSWILHAVMNFVTFLALAFAASISP